MRTINHVIVCYGGRKDYYHGAKYQILSAYQQFYNRPTCEVTVVTDSPSMFSGYPVKTLVISEEQKKAWSLEGIQHFGIKLKSLQMAMENSQSEYSMLLDTDMIWCADPSLILENLRANSAVGMYQNEGPIFNSKNKSIKRFEEGLKGKDVRIADGFYAITPESEMWGSNIIALPSKWSKLISEAHDLFSYLEPLVDAHTVEQFSVAETLRLKGIKKIPAKRYLQSWSSTGRKNYVRVQLADFFDRYNEDDFSEHLNRWREIKIRRPLFTLLNQKIKRLRKES